MVSVIVPIYNAATLVERCVDSVLSQTYQDFEIILVDDGSTDNSLQVIQALAENDRRIKVFHKENGGQTSARRYGYEQSEGDYLYFVDADDYLPQGALEFMSKIVVEKDLDIIDGMSITYTADGRERDRCDFNWEGECGSKDYVIKMFEDQANQGTHGCLLKRTLFNTEVFDLPEDVRVGEEWPFHLTLASRAKRCGIYNVAVYCYVDNDNSITHNYHFTSILPKEHQIEAIKGILERYGYFDMVKDKFYRRNISDIASFCLHNKAFINEPFVKNFAHEAKPYLKGLYEWSVYVLLTQPRLYGIFALANTIRKKFVAAKSTN